MNTANPMLSRGPVRARALGAALVLGAATLALAEERSAADLDLSLPDLEPTVSIQDHSNRVIQEYSVNGNVYMIKVTPKAGGTPYYLVDPNGSGTMQWRRSSLGMDLRVPQWALLSW